MTLVKPRLSVHYVSLLTPVCKEGSGLPFNYRAGLAENATIAHPNDNYSYGKNIWIPNINKQIKLSWLTLDTAGAVVMRAEPRKSYFVTVAFMMTVSTSGITLHVYIWTGFWCGCNDGLDPCDELCNCNNNGGNGKRNGNSNCRRISWRHLLMHTWSRIHRTTDWRASII